MAQLGTMLMQRDEARTDCDTLQAKVNALLQQAQEASAQFDGIRAERDEALQQVEDITFQAKQEMDALSLQTKKEVAAAARLTKQVYVCLYCVSTLSLLCLRLDLHQPRCFFVSVPDEKCVTKRR